MDKYRCVRFLVSAVAALLVMTTSLSVVAGELFVNIDVAGNLDARFHGLEILATMAGEVGFAGDIPQGDSSIWVSVSGSGRGVGHRDILSLITKGWILLSADGVTEDSGPVSIRSLLYATRQRLIPLQADDVIEGFHHTMIQTGETVAVYWGEFAGSLAGGLAPADTSGTIRLSGSGGFHLSGEWIPEGSCDGFPDTIPLDDPDLPAAFLQTIYDAFRTRPEAN